MSSEIWVNPTCGIPLPTGYDVVVVEIWVIECKFGVEILLSDLELKDKLQILIANLGE